MEGSPSWSMAHAWKACRSKGLEGSNPSPSANFQCIYMYKKYLHGFVAVVLSLGFFSFVNTASATECPALKAGDLFKVPQHPAVYVVTKDLKRKYFPNSEVFS